MAKPRLAVLSHVLPLPRTSGQKQRVFNTLRAAREQFHLTFITFAPQAEVEETRRTMQTICDDVVVLPSRYHRSTAKKWAHRVRGGLKSLRTGLRFSNYVIGDVELEPARLKRELASRKFDVALFEYWHAYRSAAVFQRAGIPCVLDMHDVLWMARTQRLDEDRRLPAPIKRHVLQKYRATEEHAWKAFDALIAINQAELELVKDTLPAHNVFYCPMGVDIAHWAYSREPTPGPRRIAYYGELSAPHNQEAAMRTFDEIMPRVWRKYPDVELWLVGRNPPESMRALAADPRIKVTGFLEDVRPVLRTMTAVVCPWRGRYGFRSRLIEVMALGVPVVSSADGVHGMGLQHGRGLLLGETFDELADHTLALVGNESYATSQSHLAREVVEAEFDLDKTYRKMIGELQMWIAQKAARA